MYCASVRLVEHNDIIDLDEFNQDTRNFLEIKCSGMTFQDLRNAVEETEVKNIPKSKIPKFNTQLYAFVYDTQIDFPSSDLAFDTITTNNVFRNVHRMIKFKVHLHHSHVTGKIVGYAHDFCSWQVRENKTEISIFAGNLFGFDAFFFSLKDFRQRSGVQKI